MLISKHLQPMEHTESAPRLVMPTALFDYIRPGTILTLVVCSVLLISLPQAFNDALPITIALLLCLSLGGAYCLRLWSAADFLDGLEGTAELGRVTDEEVDALRARLHKHRRILDDKILHPVINNVQQHNRLGIDRFVWRDLTRQCQLKVQAAQDYAMTAGFGLAFASIAWSAWTLTQHADSSYALSAELVTPLIALGFSAAVIQVVFANQCASVHRRFLLALDVWCEKNLNSMPQKRLSKSRPANAPASPHASKSGSSNNYPAELDDRLSKEFDSHQQGLRRLEQLIEGATESLDSRLQVTAENLAEQLHQILLQTSEADTPEPIEQTMSDESIDALAARLRSAMVSLLIESDSALGSSASQQVSLLDVEASNDESIDDEYQSGNG